MEGLLILALFGIGGWWFWNYLKAPLRAPWQTFGYECSWSRSGMCIGDSPEECECAKGKYPVGSLEYKRQKWRERS